MNYREVKDWLVTNSGSFPDWSNSRYVRTMNVLELFPSFEPYISGKSYSGNDIFALKWGGGPIKILAWSLMHGNETSAFRSFGQIDYFLRSNQLAESLNKRVTIVYIPVLNPDGAFDFIRRNHQEIDINRDARSNQTEEMRFFKSVFSTFKPQYALNLHDQRSIFGINGKRDGVRLALCIPQVSVSYLKSESLEYNRNSLRQIVNDVFTNVNYDDLALWSHFNEAYYSKAIGEWMQEAGVRTLLLESGVSGLDYNRSESVLNLSAFILSYFFLLSKKDDSGLSTPSSWELPKNEPLLRYVILRNCQVNRDELLFTTDIALQYVEYLESGELKYKLVVDDLGDLSDLIGRQEFQDISIFASTSFKIGQDVPLDIISQLNLNGLQEL